MHRRLPALLLLLLLSGCGGSQIDSIRKMAPVVLLVSLVAFTSLGPDRGLSFQAARPEE